MNEAKYIRSAFISLKTFFCLILGDLERGDKAEIDAHAFSETLAVSVTNRRNRQTIQRIIKIKFA